jgi:hypothetical protein
MATNKRKPESSLLADVLALVRSNALILAKLTQGMEDAAADGVYDTDTVDAWCQMLREEVGYLEASIARIAKASRA